MPLALYLEDRSFVNLKTVSASEIRTSFDPQVIINDAIYKQNYYLYTNNN